MPRRMMRDGRNPYGSQGGYVTSDRARNGEMSRRSYNRDYARSMRDYNREMRDYSRNERMNGEYPRQMNDGHYPMSRGQGQMYRPIEAMGYFNGYYGTEDYAHNNYNYDMARGNNREYQGEYDYNYGYDYAGDYGETLGKEELEKWNKKLMKELEEKDKAMFTKQNISQKARQMGIQMEGFSEDELLTATLMMYTDYCKALKPYVGNNMDIYVAMAKAFLIDPDASVKGGEKLAIYHDCIVEGEEEDD